MISNKQKMILGGFAVVLVLALLGITFAFGGYSSATEGEWFNISWKFRMRVEINTTSANSTDWPIEIPVNFSDLTNNQMTFDNNSIRVFEYNSSGKIISEVIYQFDPDLGYNSSRNAIGQLVFSLNGTTQPATQRIFYVYYDYLENGVKPQKIYPTQIGQEWDGTLAHINTTKLDIRLTTNGYGNVSGIYQVDDISTGVPVVILDPSDIPAEYTMLSNSTDNFTFLMSGNASFIPGPIRTTIIQQGDEVYFNGETRTTLGRMVKKYYFYYRAGPQKHGSFFKISSEFFPNTTEINRSANSSVVAMDLARSFLLREISSSAQSNNDPYSWVWATDSSGSVAGVINVNESVSGFSATNDLNGRIGISLTNTAIQVGTSIKQVAFLYFGTGGGFGVTEFLEVRNSTRSPIMVNVNQPEQFAIIVLPSINRTSFNLNQTLLIKANISQTDPYYFVSEINATINNGTPTTTDDITFVLYDDGTNGGDEIAGDRIFTNNYTFDLNSNITQWKINFTAFGNGTILNSSLFLFNVSKTYLVNITIFNYIGVVGRSVMANVSVTDFAGMIGIPGAALNCTYNGSQEILNKVDFDNGIYGLNITAPTTEGIYPVFCSATKYTNIGNDTKNFQNEPATTNLTINATPRNVLLSTITAANSSSFIVYANLTNVGRGTGKNTNITLTLLPGWGANITLENCGDLPINASCIRWFNISVPNGTAPGNYFPNFTGTWTNPDDTQNFTAIFVNVSVTANQIFNITEQMVNGTGADGTIKQVGVFTINSLGNAPATNFAFNCSGGFACSNFNTTFYPANFSSLPMGFSQAIAVIVGIPMNHSIGTFNGFINITSPAGSIEMPFYVTLNPETNLSVTTDPTNLTLSGVSFYTSSYFSFVTNLTNIGNSSARNANISFVIPNGWAINSTFQSCGNLTYNSNCTRANNVTVPNGTLDGSYSINLTAYWKNLDNTTSSKFYSMIVVVASSPTLFVQNTSLAGSAAANTTFNIFNLTVFSIGNTPVINITFNCTSGVACSNFTFGYAPSKINSLASGANVTVIINATIPYLFPAGTYSGIINASSAVGGSQLVFINVTVLSNRTWTAGPLFCRRSMNPDEGKVCDIVVNNTGNDVIDFTVINITANKTSSNATGFSIPQGGNFIFSILYNVSGFPQGIYNSTYVIIANQTASPQNLTLNISLLPSNPPLITVEINQTLGEQATLILITANVTDVANSGIGVVNLTVTKPDGTVDIANMTMFYQSGNFSRWRYVYPSTVGNTTYGNTTLRGTYNVSVFSTDNIGNMGNISTNFVIRFRLSITARTLSTQYFQDDTASILYSVRDVDNNAVQGVNVTFVVYDPNQTLVYRGNLTTDSLGTFAPLPTFSLASDAPVGTYTLRVNTSYIDPLINMPFTVLQDYPFDVAEKTISVAGLFADVETGVVWYPNNVMRLNMLIYDGQGTPVDPDNFNLTVLDPAQNVYFSIQMNSTTKRGTGYYSFSYAMPTTSATGMYLAVLNISRSSFTSMKLKAFRVAAGGPYDVRLSLAKSEVQQGTTLDFTIAIENKGEVTQDVFISYNITNAATGEVFYTASEAVLTPAFTNQSFTRSAFIFSNQPLGTYTLKAIVKYDNQQPDINASSTFVVISGRTLPPPPTPTPQTGGGGSSGGGGMTGVVTGEQPVNAIIIEKYSNDIKVYPGFKKVEYVVVRNAGKTPLNEVSLSILGIPASWYTITPASYKTMTPDNSTVFLIEYNIPRDAALGEQKFNLIATTTTTSDQKAVTLEVLGSVEDLITAEINQLKEDLKSLLMDIGAARNQGKNVADVLLITDQIDQDIKNAETNHDLGNTQTALSNIQDAKVLLDRAKDLLSKLQATKLEGELNLFLVGAVVLLIVALVAIFIIKKKNLMPKQISQTVQQFTSIIERIKAPKATPESASREKEKMLRMLSVLDRERAENIISESAYNEMKKNIESKLARIKK